MSEQMNANLHKIIWTAIFDPGATEGFKGDRDLTTWQTGAVMTAISQNGFQSRVAGAHHALFHDDQTDIPERIARFLEEANELCQSLGMTRDEAHKLVDYTFGRPIGEPKKEVGGAMVTLASICVVAGIDLMECAEADLAALQTPEKIAKVRAKRATRHGRGPLPGFDPASPNTGYERE